MRRVTEAPTSSSRRLWTRRSSVNLRLRQESGSNKVQPRNREHHAGGRILWKECRQESGSISRPTPSRKCTAVASLGAGWQVWHNPQPLVRPPVRRLVGVGKSLRSVVVERNLRGDGFPLLQPPFSTLSPLGLPEPRAVDLPRLVRQESASAPLPATASNVVG